MRISDWSSDVCSSDLLSHRTRQGGTKREQGSTSTTDSETTAMPEYGKRRRFAIVTFDPDRVQALSCQTGEIPCLGTQIVQGLRGTAYDKERGLINITLLDQVEIGRAHV